MVFNIMDKINNNSIGIVKTNTVAIKQSLKLDCGKTLNDFSLIYETYGRLNSEKSNSKELFSDINNK